MKQEEKPKLYKSPNRKIESPNPEWLDDVNRHDNSHHIRRRSPPSKHRIMERNESTNWMHQSELLTELNDDNQSKQFTQNNVGCGVFRSIFHSRDPYVRLTLIPTKDSKATRCIRGVKQNAKWKKSDDNDLHFFIRSHWISNGGPLKMLIEVWDAEFNANDKFIGSRVVNLHSITRHEGTCHKLQITLRDGAQFKGILTLNIHFSQSLSAAQRSELESHIIKREKTKRIGMYRSKYGMIGCEVLTLEGADAEPNNFRKMMEYMLAVTVIFVYIAIGCMAYHFLEDWSFVDSVYFTMLSMSLVGFGDLAPSNDMSRIFTAVYVLIAHLSIFCAITTVTQWIIDRRVSKRIAHQTIQKRRRVLLRTLGREAKQHSQSMEDLCDDMDHETDRGVYPDIVWYFVLFCIWFIVWTVYFAVFCQMKMSWGHAAYFAMTTATTVGYGDQFSLSKKDGFEDEAKIFISFAVLIGVAFLANIAGSIAVYIDDMKQEQIQSNVLQTALKFEDLKEFDLDGDENVTQAEFLQWMLIKMKLVDKSILDRINTKFHAYGGLEHEGLSFDTFRRRLHNHNMN